MKGTVPDRVAGKLVIAGTRPGFHSLAEDPFRGGAAHHFKCLPPLRYCPFSSRLLDRRRHEEVDDTSLIDAIAVFNTLDRLSIGAFVLLQELLQA